MTRCSIDSLPFERMKTALLPQRIWLALLVPLLLVVVGTLGFHLLEGMSLLESVYLTVISLTTIGYGDIVPKTPAGRIFTMFLVISGVFTLFYAATALIRVVVGGELTEHLGKQQMERALAQRKDHIIVCGYGRMGRLACAEFSREKTPFVVIDKDAEAMRDFDVPFGVGLVGDATEDADLKRAGIERARGLLTVMASDADNLFTTMSAKLLNPALFVVARVESSGSEEKMRRAGANRIVCPYLIGGNRAAQAILRPTVMDFIELATRTEHIELQLEESRVEPNSALAGVSLKDSHIRADLKVIIVAIKTAAGKMNFNPAPETTIQAGDILVAIGHREHLEKLDALARTLAKKGDAALFP